jgi:alpha-mannosidase
LVRPLARARAIEPRPGRVRASLEVQGRGSEDESEPGILQGVADRIPLYYTFGNHQHWVDLQWLWGYHVMPGSIRDMLTLCSEAGVKGCVNFDGIGYEKLAAEDPEAFAQLKAAVREGTFEIVGGSYGQPYGLFHGGESNVRQRIFGARTVQRLFGVKLKTFWEEEFDFCPQLPQILRGVGMEFASLFFQWTWHTPEVPREDVPVVWWEGQDGSRLLCATRNKLNLHQWPEDMALTFASLADGGVRGDGKTPSPASSPIFPIPLVLQWLELMPTPDWMCRSELILPKLKELLGDPRFEVRPVTLGEYLGIVAQASSLSADPETDGNGLEACGTSEEQVPVRRYTLHDVWHGMTLGKNGDNMRRLSRDAEASLLSAETLAAIAGLFGRPYAQWDVYPTWELEEAWRELLSAQHHDNDECEGLCGHVGRFSYERSLKLSRHVVGRNLREIGKRIAGDGKKIRLISASLGSQSGREEADGSCPKQNAIVFNPLGWERSVIVRRGDFASKSRIDRIPALGFKVVDVETQPTIEQPRFEAGERSTLEHVGLRVTADLQLGFVEQVASAEFPEGVFLGPGAFGFRLIREREQVNVEPSRTESYKAENPWRVGFRRIHTGDDRLDFSAAFSEIHHGVEARIWARIERPDGGLNAALHTAFRLSFRPKILVDHPMGVSEIKPIEKGLKKYPTGDWMTSPQWFEEVHDAFQSQTLVDLVDADNPDRGLLIVHDGCQQWFLGEDNTVRCILNAYDPWDEDYFVSQSRARFLLVPHGPVTNSERWKMAQEFLREPKRAFFDGEPTGPTSFSAASCDADNVALTAFYRETRDSAKGQPAHAADALGVDYPYVLRMVELDGIETDATVTFGATVAKAVRTNLLGEVESELNALDSKIAIHLRPYEIATVYMDLVEGRKQVRDLDAKREIWATVHRVEE